MSTNAVSSTKSVLSELLEEDDKVGFLSGQASSTTIREEINYINNWRESSHDTINTDNDLFSNTILFSSSLGKRSSSDAESIAKKAKVDDQEVVLFGPIPTSTFIPDPHYNFDNALMDDEAIFQEFERITSNDTLYPLSPPTSPILSHTNYEELIDDFILFP